MIDDLICKFGGDMLKETSGVEERVFSVADVVVVVVATQQMLLSMLMLLGLEKAVHESITIVVEAVVVGGR
ncbi:hypothetical protein BVRB_1g021220 [Beta vulgaris subsp. vulgaris]|nr:hypothetical protein BVRB_1g021220 [Beta vulgaris subsp. vulgaris]